MKRITDPTLFTCTLAEDMAQRLNIDPEMVKRLNELEASLSYIEFEMNRNTQLRGYHYPSWRRGFVLSSLGSREIARRYCK